MTYVRDQSSAELATHIRSLQKMPGWFDPLADRLWQEVEMLRAEVDSLTREADRQYTTIEAYRHDAERYQWLRSGASVILNKEVGFTAESGARIYSTMPSQRELDSAIDAAMSKEPQP